MRTILFIGDSITDCGRRNDAEQLGDGYVRIIRDWLIVKEMGGAPRVINRGISGNRVTDLRERWREDVLALSPTTLSIKIGINDVWHSLGGRNEGVPLPKFVDTYREILQMTRRELPNCHLVLCEPSVIWPPQPAEGNTVLRGYVSAVHDLAREYHAQCVVPLHGVFNRAREARPDVVWAPDGVHPSHAGHMLIARTWLATTGML